MYFPIRGHDKSAPTAANGLPITWRHSAKHQRTHREKSTNTYEKPTKHSANTQRSPTK
ncbi:MAG: hypothetical protein HXN67_07590 [Prevotella pallens]|nr:hypothetical protein [Prevotella pallens]